MCTHHLYLQQQPTAGQALQAATAADAAAPASAPDSKPDDAAATVEAHSSDKKDAAEPAAATSVFGGSAGGFGGFGGFGTAGGFGATGGFGGFAAAAKGKVAQRILLLHGDTARMHSVRSLPGHMWVSSSAQLGQQLSSSAQAET